MRGEFAAVLFYKCCAEFNGIAFDDNIKIVDWLAEQKVTHEAADNIAGHAQGCGLVGNVRE